MLAADTLESLYRIILERRNANPEESYVAKRFKQGRAKIAQKVGEEAVELVIASMQKDKKEIVLESADLLFHWLLLLAEHNVPPSEVMHELRQRAGISGIAEKNQRKE